MASIKVILAVATSGFAILFWATLAYRIATYGVQLATPGHVPYFLLAVFLSIAALALWVWVVVPSQTTPRRISSDAKPRAVRDAPTVSEISY
jgi:hypothetical protein